VAALSAYQRLEVSLRRLKRMRELRAPDAIIASEIELARRFWSRVTPAPDGARLVWPEDILPLAMELGFEPDTRPRPQLDPRVAEEIARARAQFGIADRIAKALLTAGIADAEVSVSPGAVELHGRASDSESRDRAATIAAELAAGLAVVNRIDLTS